MDTNLIKKQLDDLGVKPASSNDSRYNDLVRKLSGAKTREEFVSTINKNSSLVNYKKLASDSLNKKVYYRLKH